MTHEEQIMNLHALPAHGMAQLRELVDNYNMTQGMACAAVRMDPYSPCNGMHGRLCMQCPRKKGAALVTETIPG